MTESSLPIHISSLQPNHPHQRSSPLSSTKRLSMFNDEQRSLKKKIKKEPTEKFALSSTLNCKFPKFQRFETFDNKVNAEEIRVHAGNGPLEKNLISKVFYFDVGQLMSILCNGGYQSNETTTTATTTTTTSNDTDSNVSNKCLKIQSLNNTELHCPQSPLDWMYRVRLAANCFEQNLIAISNTYSEQDNLTDGHTMPAETVFGNRISMVFRTIRSVAAHEELRFWPSLSLLFQLDIPPFLAPSNIVNGRCYLCHRCGRCYTQPNPLKIHLRFECPMSLTPQLSPPQSLFPRFLTFPTAFPPTSSVQYSTAYLMNYINTATNSTTTTTSTINSLENTSLTNLKSQFQSNQMLYGLGNSVHPTIRPRLPSLMSLPIHCSLTPPPPITSSLLSSHSEPQSPIISDNNFCSSSSGGATTSTTTITGGSTTGTENNQLTIQQKQLQKQLKPAGGVTKTSAGVDRRLKRLNLSKLIFPNGNQLHQHHHHHHHQHYQHRHHHQRQHNRKLHNCSYCGKVYTRKYGLKIHIRTHTGLKPLSCRFCGRSFSDPSNLNKHVRLHTQQQQQQQQQQQLQQSRQLGPNSSS